jgi:hypothetical protein
MADLNLNGHTKVKTFKAKFRETFGATLRVYKDVACQEGFADDEATLAAIRTAGAKGGELTVRSHMQVGNFEKKVAKLYGIGIQIANAEDTELVDDSITLSEVGSVTTTKTSENSSKKNHVRIEIEYTEYEYAPIDEYGAMIGDSVAFCFHEYSDTEIYIDDELSDEEAETEFSGYKPYKFEKTERMGCWVNSVREVYYLNVENFDASKLVMYYDCYDVPYNNRTREVSFISLKYDGKVIESDQESYSCKNKDFLEISIPTEFVEENVNLVEEIEEVQDEIIEEDDIEEEFEDEDFCDNVTYLGLEYSCYDGEAEASMFEDEKLETADAITIPQTITDEESGKTFTVNGYTISDGAYTNITFPSTLKYIQGETFSDMDEDVLNQMQHNLAENKNFVVKERYIYQYTSFEDNEQVYQLCNVQLNRPKGSFAIPEGVQAIARGLFTNCDQLVEVIIPSSVRHIDDAPFEGCCALKRIVVYAPEHQVKCYDDCGEDCKLENFIPKGVELVYMSNPATGSEAGNASADIDTSKEYEDLKEIRNEIDGGRQQ